jgi:hypothetical protein
MKRLIVLTSLMMLSLTTFSQTDTKTKCFPESVAKMIAKDLLSGDSAKVQLKLTEEQLLETEKKVDIKDSVITTMKLKEVNYNTIISTQNEKYITLEGYTKKIEFALKKEKIKNKLTSILSGGMMLALTILLI